MLSLAADRDKGPLGMGTLGGAGFPLYDVPHIGFQKNSETKRERPFGRSPVIM
jgi:hypothetical protein